MSDDKKLEQPLHVDEVDSQALEILQLKAEKAQMLFDAALSAFRAKFADLGKRYDFDPATTQIDFAARTIKRG